MCLLHCFPACCTNKYLCVLYCVLFCLFYCHSFIIYSIKKTMILFKPNIILVSHGHYYRHIYWYIFLIWQGAIQHDKFVYMVYINQDVMLSQSLSLSDLLHLWYPFRWTGVNLCTCWLITPITERNARVVIIWQILD